MPKRSYSAAGSYRYGFNGKENDNEVKGLGNLVDFGFRIYDPRVGRFLSIDPLTNKYPQASPYHFADNSPVFCVDIDGLEKIYYYSLSKDGFKYLSVLDLGDNGKADKAVLIVQGIGMHRIKKMFDQNYQPSNDVFYVGGANSIRSIARAVKVLTTTQTLIPNELPDKTWYGGEADTKHEVTLDEVGEFMTGEEFDDELTKLQWWQENGASVALLGNMVNELTAPGQTGGAHGIQSEESQNGSGNSSWATKLKVPDRVQSRINIANGRTRFTPLRPSTGEPVSAGFNHVVEGHFDRPISWRRSVFTISRDELKKILQSEQVVSSPVTAIKGGQFVRTVDMGRIIGTTNLRQGGTATSRLQVLTDQAGNLITSYPVR